MPINDNEEDKYTKDAVVYVDLRKIREEIVKYYDQNDFEDDGSG